MRNRRWRLTAVCFFVLFLLGFEAGGFQISLLKIIEAEGFSSGLSGVLVSGQYGAIIIMPLLVGGFADRRGKRKVLAASCLIFALGAFGMSTLHAFGALMLSAFAIGTGYSVSESIGSALLAEVHGEKSGKYMNLSQCFFSLGAMASPQILELGSRSFGWSYQSLFRICAIAGLAACVLVPVWSGKDVPAAVSTEKEVRPIGREILYLAAGLFVYAGLEGGISYYLDSFAATELMRPEHGANMLSLFWLFMLGGRVICGLLYRYRRVLLGISLFGTGIFLFILSIFPSLAAGYICFSLIGLCLASIWPNLMSLAVEGYEGNSAQAAGIISTGGGLGSVLSPLFLGMIMNGAGLRVGFGVLGVFSLAGMLICGGYYRTMEKRQDRSYGKGGIYE